MEIRTVMGFSFIKYIRFCNLKVEYPVEPNLGNSELLFS